MKRIVRRQPAAGGYTNAERWRVEFADGTRGFVKRGVDADTSEWLRIEHRVYTAFADQPWLPRMLDFEDGEFATLILEDLGDAHWPPPWKSGHVDRVCAALDQVHAQPIPDFVPEAGMDKYRGWHLVAADPEAFLGLGMVDERWLEASLPRLLEAESELPDGPMSMVHLDTRSDNLCFDGDRTLIVDWNWVQRAPAGVDKAFWSVSLHHEGGPPPEQIVDPHCCWPARVSGFFASRAGLPVIPHAPRVRWIQQVQLRVALPWAVRALGLPSLALE